MTQTRHDLVLPAALASSPAISPLLIQFQPPGSSGDIPKHANFAPSPSLCSCSLGLECSLLRSVCDLLLHSALTLPPQATRVKCHLPWTPYPFTLFVFIMAITK